MIYFLQRSNGDVKIGTTRRYKGRLRDLETKHGALTLLGWHEGGIEDEVDLHDLFASDRVRGEWFTNSDRLREYIDQACEPGAPPEPEFAMGNVQMSLANRCALTLLKKKWKLPTMDAVIGRLLEDFDKDIYELAIEISRLENEYTT